MNRDVSESDPVIELANQYLERYRKGENPSVSEYAERYPELADQIRDVFPMMLLMEDHAPSATQPDMAGGSGSQPSKLERLGDFRILREIGRGGMGIVYEAVQESLNRHVALKVFPTHSNLNPRHQERFKRESRSAAMLHHTNIVPVFAVGDDDGMLFYAMQFIRGAGLDDVIAELRRLRPDRERTSAQSRTQQNVVASQVAKSILSGGNGRASFEVEEMEQEARALSSNDGSVASGVHLPGQSDDATLSETGKEYWQSVARIGVQVAQALDYAHGQKTLHRDIKPSNLLLDQEATVWVTDFGLAKSIDEEDLTHTGELIGTLRYMPPEQFSGKADERSDLYSLGLTLYELLTLRPAFDLPDRQRLIRAINDSQPPRPRKISSQIPRDLETIVLKCIEHDPSRRYQTASQLVGDLTRFLNNEPLKARPVGTTERVIKWAKRRPAIAGLAAALALTFVVSFALITWKWREAESVNEDLKVSRQAVIDQRVRAVTAEKDMAIAEAKAEFTDQLVYYERIWRARDHLQANEISQAVTALEQCNPEPGEIDRRGLEWHYLNRLLNADLMKLSAGTIQAPWIRSIACSADGTRFATGASAPINFRNTLPGVRGAAKVWDMVTGELVLDLQGQTGSIQSVALNVDGSRLATCEFDVVARADAVLRVWDVESKEQLWELTLPDGYLQQLTFSLDGELLAAIRRRSDIGVWNATTGEQLCNILPTEQGHRWSNSVRTFHFGPDGQSIIACGDGNTHPSAEYDALTGDPLSVGQSTLYGMMDSTGTYQVRVAGETAFVHSVASGKLVHAFRQQGRLWQAAFRPDGRQLVTSGSDGTVRLWNIATGNEETVFRGHTNHVISLAFSPTGDRVISGDWSGVVKVWDVTRHPERIEVFPNATGSIPVDFEFDPDGEHIKSIYQNTTGRTVYLSKWNSIKGSGLRSLGIVDFTQARVAPGRIAAMDNFATRIAGRAQTDPRLLKVFDANTGQELQSFDHHKLPIQYAVISGAGNRTASFSNPPPDSTDVPAELNVWDTDGGNLLLSIKDPNSRYEALALSADGNLLAVARQVSVDESTAKDSQDSGTPTSQSIEIWNVDAQGEFINFPLASQASALEFNRQGSLLASADIEAVCMWNIETGELEHRSEITDRIEDLAFDPEGKRLAGATRSRTTVWGTEIGHKIITLRGPPRTSDPAFSPRVCFSPDGKRLASLQWTAQVWIWNAEEFDDHVRQRRLETANARGKFFLKDRDEFDVTANLRGWWLAALESLNQQIEANPGQSYLIGRRLAVYANLGLTELAAAEYAREKELRNDGLWFTGNGEYVAAPHVPFDTYEGFTIETWIKNWRPMKTGGGGMVIYQGFGGEKGVQFFDNRGACFVSGPDQKDFGYESRVRFGFGRYPNTEWAHLAVVFDGSQVHSFANGKLIDSKDLEGLGKLNPEAKFLIGESAVFQRNLRGSGMIGAVRVSKSARYAEDFSPQRRLGTDDDTVLLFDFFNAEGKPQDTHIPDLSGNDNHGELINVDWLK